MIYKRETFFIKIERRMTDKEVRILKNAFEDPISGYDQYSCSVTGTQLFVEGFEDRTEARAVEKSLVKMMGW